MIPKIYLDRSGKVPRSAIIFGAILLVAAVALFVASRQEKSDDLVLGGPLFNLENTEIEGFLLTQDGAQYRFDRNENGYWTLRGATSDFLIQGAVYRFVEELKNTRGGRVLPGTEVDDRRYEFNGPDALRLTIFTSDGARQSLAVGMANPITGYFYASGAGRPACFPVTEFSRHQIAALPNSLQLQVLLPRFARSLIEVIDLQYGKEMHQLRRFDNRWWLRAPSEGSIALGSAAGSYHQQYDDRRMARDDHTWLLASDAAISRLIYEVSETNVNDIPPTRFAKSRLKEWELDPPWRHIVLHGAGINPDSSEVSGDVLEMSFGPGNEDDRVPALRRGNVLLTEMEALRRLGSPLGELLDLGADSFLAAYGDSLRVWREGQLLIRGYRGEAPEVEPGSRPRPGIESWLTTFPLRKMRPDITDLGYDGMVRYLITDLDRLEILAVLPPVKDRRILTANERVVMEIDTPDGLQKIEIGYLNREFLPAGSRAPVGTDDGAEPVAIWRPITGQLMQVPNHILVTMRNRATFSTSRE